MGKGSGLPCQPGGNASPGGGTSTYVALPGKGGEPEHDYVSCRAGQPFTGLPRAQPHKALALDGVIW